MQFVDTHCHIHFPDYPLEIDQVIADAKKAGVEQMVCVGCTLTDSKLAVEVAKKNPSLKASIGLHPHESSQYINDPKALQSFGDLAKDENVMAIGEIGLDYYYNHSDKADQQEMLKFQLTIAQEHNLPVIFHVREAFDDFWPIYDQFKPRGVIHSFTAGESQVQQIIDRGLYIGLNGIMTFSKNQEQLEAVKAIPLENIVLETDAPFLTPVPFRGTICQPKHVVDTAQFLSEHRGEKLEDFASVTTANAKKLFRL